MTSVRYRQTNGTAVGSSRSGKVRSMADPIRFVSEEDSAKLLTQALDSFDHCNAVVAMLKSNDVPLIKVQQASFFPGKFVWRCCRFFHKNMSQHRCTITVQGELLSTSSTSDSYHWRTSTGVFAYRLCRHMNIFMRQDELVYKSYAGRICTRH